MNLLEMLLRGRYGFEAGMLSLAALLENAEPWLYKQSAGL
jgi:hypothetical protein